MTHAINFVDDCELPDGQDFIFVAVPDGGLIFYRESAVTPRTLEASWAAYRLCASGRPDAPNTTRHLSLVATG